ncbi:MAG: tyrosine-type recombinase/integrase [Methylobacter sp.]
MSVKQTKDGKWLVQIDRKGIPRVRITKDVKSEAESFEREYLATHLAKQKRASTDQRTLKDLVALWFKYHGVSLSDGERRQRALEDLAVALKNPQASELTAEQFVLHRFDRLQAGINPKTMNNHHGYLLAVYNKLRKINVIDYENPLKGVDFIKVQESQVSYLSIEQINLLLDTIKSGCVNESTWYVAHICLRTGARWGEAEQLRFKQLHGGMVTYEFTKSKKTRSVPLETDFYRDLIGFARYKGPNDRVFTNCIGAFRRAMKRAGIETPRGQCSHILRHSFASHFVMRGGNIVTLQKILGHADITQTMTYAHLAPEHLADAIRLNPVAL